MSEQNYANAFGNMLKYHMSGQWIVRIFSSLMNLYLIRVVDLPLMGFISVRMTLLYQTIGFLSREPLRKTCLSSALSVKDSLHYSFLSTLLFFILGAICGFIWWCLPLPDVELHEFYGATVLIFIFSAFLEGIVEPIAILSLKMDDNAHYALSHSLLALLQKLIAVVLILSGISCALTALCAAQLGASFCYAILHVHKFSADYLPRVRNLFDKPWMKSFTSYQYDSKYFALIGTIFAHSLLKQFLTSGSGYIMAFTNIFSLKTQAVYDVIERLASLVTRLILTPLEETATIYFAREIRHPRSANEEKNSPVNYTNETSTIESAQSGVSKEAVTTFAMLLRILTILGLTVCVFGVPYAGTVARLYGGEILTQNEGGKFLALYTFYIFFMALNGIIECFAFSSMNTTQIFSHGTFLLFSAVLHIVFNVIFAVLVGASGFIVANCLNTILRIFYNWRHIRVLLGRNLTRQLSINALRPTLSTAIMLIMSFFVTTLSMVIFGSTGGYIHTGAHLIIGAVLFLFVMMHIHHSENLFLGFSKKIC